MSYESDNFHEYIDPNEKNDYGNFDYDISDRNTNEHEVNQRLIQRYEQTNNYPSDFKEDVETWINGEDNANQTRISF